MQVVIRPDSSPIHGAGHAMRCLAIAEELSRSGADVVWILNSDPIPWVSRLLRERGWTTVVTIQGAEAA